MIDYKEDSTDATNDAAIAITDGFGVSTYSYLPDKE